MAQEVIRSTAPDGREVLSNILDQYTGELLEFKETDTNKEGNPIQDSDIVGDGIIYIKKYGKYFKRQFTELNVKWFGAVGDGITQDTLPIRAALSFGGNIFIPEGVYLVSPALPVVSNSKITLHKNAVITMNKDADGNYRIFSLSSVNNVSISGGTIIGDKYKQTEDNTGSQWGHGIGISGSTNIKIHDITIKGCWGDGISLGGQSEYVLIDNVVCDDNRRQGMSIISCSNIKVTNSSFNNTSRISATDPVDPRAGVDIEPNTGDTVENIEFINCEFNNNEGAGIYISTPVANSNKTIRNVKLINVNAKGNQRSGINITTATPENIGGIENVRVDNAYISESVDLDLHIYGAIDTKVSNVKTIHTSDTQPSIRIYRSEGTVVSNIDVDSTATEQPSLVIDSSTSIRGTEVRGGRIVSTGDSVLISQNARNLIIQGMIVSSAQGVGIRLENNCDQNIITNNSILSAGESGIVLTSSCDYNTVSQNKINNIGIFSTLEEDYIRVGASCRANIITGNNYWNDTSPAGSTSNAVSFATTSRFNIYNNNNTDNPLNESSINSYKDDSGNLNIYTIDDVYRSGSTGNRPTGVQRGFIYYDTTIQNPIIWTGSAWGLMARGATTSEPGLIEIASSSEVSDGTSNSVAVTPLSLQNKLNATVVASSETVSGIIEIATQGETNTGTDDSRAVTPLKLQTKLDSTLNQGVLTNPDSTSLTPYTEVANTTYDEQQIQALMFQVEGITTQYNTLLTQYEELKAKLEQVIIK